MEITYLSAPLRNRFPIASRILTTNLSNNKKFKVNFAQDLHLKCYTSGFNKWKDLWSKNNDLLNIEDEKSYDVFARKWVDTKYNKFDWNSKFTSFYIHTGALDSIYLEGIKTETIFYSSYSFLDFRLIKKFLNDKRKIVLGGPLTMIYSFEEIRNFLIGMGVDEKIAKNNLIIVSGYVDLTTDLYEIFERWEDIEIKENDFTTMWDCNKDGFVDKIKIYRLFDINLSTIMRTKCWWGKCKFCSFNCIPEHDFTKGTSIDKMIQHYKTLKRNYQTNNLFFNDSYFIKTPFNMEVFRRLTKEDFEVGFFTGVKLMSNERYLKFLNEINISSCCIGMESVNDFCLDYVNKGYKRKDIDYMLSQIKKYINKPINLCIFIMMDLPRNSTSKSQAIKDIQNDWEYIAELKRKLVDMGNECQIVFSPFKYLPEKKEIIDNNLLRHAKKEDIKYERLSGLSGLYDYFSRKLNIDISEMKETDYPVVRYLPNGEFLESDMHYVDKNILRNI